MSRLPGPDIPYEEWDEESRRIFESDFADFLGMKIGFDLDKESPPIDYEDLSAFIRRELEDIQSLEVSHLIATYRPWYDAFREVLIRDASRTTMGTRWESSNRNDFLKRLVDPVSSTYPPPYDPAKGSRRSSDRLAI